MRYRCDFLGHRFVHPLARALFAHLEAHATDEGSARGFAELRSSLPPQENRLGGLFNAAQSVDASRGVVEGSKGLFGASRLRRRTTDERDSPAAAAAFSALAGGSSPGPAADGVADDDSDEEGAAGGGGGGGGGGGVGGLFGRRASLEGKGQSGRVGGALGGDFLSRASLEGTMSRDYFLMLGQLSASPRGLQLLSRYHVWRLTTLPCPSPPHSLALS